jgi:hypothetical protein
MKKIFTLIAVALCAMSASAQTSYLLDDAAATASGASTGSTFSFLVNDLTFKIDNDKTKSYAAGGQVDGQASKSVKYSAAVYTVTLPTGVSISSMIMEGYGNDASADGSISDINGVDVTSSNYVFTAGKDPAKSQKYTYTFPTAVTGSFTFTVKSKQICAYLTLISSGTAGINQAETETIDDNATPQFTVAGQPLNGSYKGIIIQKGKKFVNK